MANAFEAPAGRGAGWRRGLIITGIAALAASCGGGTPAAPTGDAGPKPCTEDYECPGGQNCVNGFCAGGVLVDGGFDAAGPPQIVVTPTVLTYGNPYVGGEYAQTFTIRNVGQSLLTVKQLDLVDNTLNKDFAISAPATPFTVVPDPQESVTITVTLRPTDNAVPSGVIHVVSDDPATVDVPVQLAATVKDAADLGVCVLQGATVADGCTVSPSDNTPLVDLGQIPYGQSGNRVVSLTNAGSGNIAEKIAAVKFNPSTGTAHYRLDIFTLDGSGAEVPVTAFPFFLNPVDPSGQVAQNELRARVTFTADNVDGPINGVGLEVDSDHPDNSKTIIPIVGVILGCKPAAGDGGTALDGGADPLTDPNNCGYCGNHCTLAHASAKCEGGVCKVELCETNWGNCDTIESNGCETDLLSAVGHCGMCSKSCTNQHGSTVCTNGQCYPNCNNGYDICSGDPALGCQVALNTVSNCGSCGAVCANNHGSTTCLGSQCAPTCATGFGDCDGHPENGCETDFTQLDTCGTCSTKCKNDNGTTSCNGTACVPVCTPGFGDCNGNVADGCETNLSGVTFCGACANDSQCPTGFYCTGTQCEKRHTTGVGCGANKECATGFCADGVCCDGACDTACRACNQIGNVGTCTNLPAFATDNSPAGACLAPNACDGNGACKQVNGYACPNGAADCASGNCVDGVCCNSTCTGQCQACSAAKKGSGADGTCGNIAANTDPDQECAGGLTCTGGGACRANCAADAQCESGYFCNNTAAGSCILKKATGGACASDPIDGSGAHQCTVPNCVDGYCCDTACNAGACDVCNGGALGFAGAANGTCFNAPAGWGGSPSCSPYLCGGAATCGTTCAADTDCATGSYCATNATCQPQKSQGAACNATAGQDCRVGGCRVCGTAGGCVDGYCCNTACAGGACDVCNGAALGIGGAVNGTCSNATAGYAGSPSCAPYVCTGGAACPVTCASDAQCAAGDYCDATSHCVPQKPQGTTCNVAAGQDCLTAGCRACGTAGGCVDGYCCNTTCAGGPCDICNAAALGFGGTQNGTCTNAPAGYAGNPSCAPYLCGGGVSCASACSSDNDCAAGTYCDRNGSCVAQKAQGLACNVAAGQDCRVAGCRACGSAGGCVDGYCCNTTCAGGECDVCNGAALGFGGAVNGTCFNAPTTYPGNPSCSPYYCGGGATCAATCTGDANCIAADYCDNTGHCAPRKAQGNACNTTTDCKVAGCRECTTAGGCVDGFCCDTACNGGACDVCNGAALGFGGANGTCAIAPLGYAGSPACGTAYLCNGASASCPVTCTSDSQCIAGDYCDSTGHCVPQKAQGNSCDTTADCKVPGCRECGSAGGCVDGVCCDTTCTGTCMACNVATHVGTCWNIPLGGTDAVNCAAPTYVCNGSGGCKVQTGYPCAAGGGGDAACMTNHCCSPTCRDLANDVGNCGACGTNCAALPQVFSSSCVGSACVINQCQSDYYNLDSVSGNGCECHDDATGHHTCTDPTNNTAIDLGSIDDNNNGGVNGLMASGNLPFNGAVYYKFKAYNNRWNAGLGYNPFNLKVGFTVNNGMRLEVMRDSCTADATCGGGSQPVGGTRAAGEYFQWDVSTWVASPGVSENPCLTYVWPGYNVCVNHGPLSAFGDGADTYFIKITWLSPPTSCAASQYTIQVTNGT
ncbi:MAG TPA: choice-of-anchor D domain-containing protein [Polyangia bacterium]|jgi:hypothetical protein